MIRRPRENAPRTRPAPQWSLSSCPVISEDGVPGQRHVTTAPCHMSSGLPHPCSAHAFLLPPPTLVSTPVHPLPFQRPSPKPIVLARSQQHPRGLQTPHLQRQRTSCPGSICGAPDVVIIIEAISGKTARRSRAVCDGEPSPGPGCNSAARRHTASSPTGPARDPCCPMRLLKALSPKGTISVWPDEPDAFTRGEHFATEISCC